MSSILPPRSLPSSSLPSWQRGAGGAGGRRQGASGRAGAAASRLSTAAHVPAACRAASNPSHCTPGPGSRRTPNRAPPRAPCRAAPRAHLEAGVHQLLPDGDVVPLLPRLPRVGALKGGVRRVARRRLRHGRRGLRRAGGRRRGRRGWMGEASGRGRRGGSPAGQRQQARREGQQWPEQHARRRGGTAGAAAPPARPWQPHLLHLGRGAGCQRHNVLRVQVVQQAVGGQHNGVARPHLRGAHAEHAVCSQGRAVGWLAGCGGAGRGSPGRLARGALRALKAWLSGPAPTAPRFGTRPRRAPSRCRAACQTAAGAARGKGVGPSCLQLCRHQRAAARPWHRP